MNPLTRRNVGIFSPYFHILGGGERYLLTIAQVMEKTNTVTLFTSQKIADRASQTFHIPLGSMRIEPRDAVRGRNIIQKYRTLSKFDRVFYMTDGSVFFAPSGKNFLIIQSPRHIPANSFRNALKLRRWTPVCYSSFMQQIIRNKLGIEAAVLSPAVETDLFGSQNAKKEQLILSVGRFFHYPHNKKHDVLIDVFTKNYKKHFNGWRFVIAGGLTEKAGQTIVTELQAKAEGFPVDIRVNVPFSQLVDLYRQASIYWHAAGYGEDLTEHPERAEHFGITTVEAMAAGDVPIVFAGGGQKDVVHDQVDGSLWQTEEELVRQSVRVMTDPAHRSKLSKAAVARARDFSLEAFEKKLNEIISD